MKIDDLMGDVISKYSKQSKVAEKKPAKSADKAKDSTVQTTSTQEDRVEISKSAKVLLELDDGGNGRADKVKSIKLAVNNGTYKPNLEGTAKAMLKEWFGE